MKKEEKEIEVIEIGEIDLCKVPKDVLDTFIATLEKEICKAIKKENVQDGNRSNMDC